MRLKLRITSFLAMLCFVPNLATRVLSAPQARAPEGLELGPVVKAINQAIDEAQANNVLGFPDLKKATVQLSTTLLKETSGKVKLLIFSLGGSGAAEAGTTITLELTVPSTTSRIEPSAVKVQELKRALARAINHCKVAFVEAHRAGSKLEISEVGLEVKFAVTKSVEGGVDTADLLPISLEVGRKIQTERVHTVTLTFGK